MSFLIIIALLEPTTDQRIIIYHKPALREVKKKNWSLRSGSVMGGPGSVIARSSAPGKRGARNDSAHSWPIMLQPGFSLTWDVDRVEFNWFQVRHRIAAGGNVPDLMRQFPMDRKESDGWRSEYYLPYLF